MIREWLKIFMQPVTCSKQYVRKMNLAEVIQKGLEEAVGDCSNSKSLDRGSHRWVERRGKIPETFWRSYPFHSEIFPSQEHSAVTLGAENGANLKMSFLFKTDCKNLLILPNVSWSEKLRLNGSKNKIYD